ncbi:hypothetical protein BJX62DRAFT_205570 [Aspergillus germanicus]
MHPHTLTYPDQAAPIPKATSSLLILSLPQSHSTQRRPHPRLTILLPLPILLPLRDVGVLQLIHCICTIPPLSIFFNLGLSTFGCFASSTCYFLSVFLVSCGVVISVSKSPVLQSRIY